MPQALRTLNGIICKYGLTQCIENPTHDTERSSSIIDLILIRNNNSLIKCGVANPFLEQNTRYHCPVFAIFKFTKPKTASFSRHVWLYDAADFDLLRQECNSFDWNFIYDDDINKWVEHFTATILNLCKRFIPNRKVTIKPHEPKWITNEIKRLIRKRKRLYRKATQSNNHSDMQEFKKLRNNIVVKIRTAKKEYVDNAAQQIETLRAGGQLSKHLWKVISSHPSHH